MDVVPTGPWEMWRRPPFDAYTEGDWLYGRGGGDMKAGLAANIAALDALRRLGLQPAATVYIQSVVEEECTGNGALACLVRGYKADAALIPEPEDDKLVRANTGVIWFRVHVKGQPVHVREASTGANAIEAAYRLIQALRGLESNGTPARRSTDISKGYRAPHQLQRRQNRGRRLGVVGAGVVLVRHARVAIYPGINPRDAAAEIEACLSAASRNDAFLSTSPPQVEYNGFFAEGYVLEEGSTAELALGRAHAASYGRASRRSSRPAISTRAFSRSTATRRASCMGPIPRASTASTSA